MRKRLFAFTLALVMVLGCMPMPALADEVSSQTFNGHDADEFMVTYLGDVPTYTGQPQEPVPVVSCQNETLVEGQDYSVSYENNINATDEAWIIITGCGSYEGLILRHPFTIQAYDLTDFNYLQLMDTVPYSVPLRYTKPIVDKNGNTLVEGVDYVLRHEAILEGDDWTRIYVYGIGNYTGATNATITLSYGGSGDGESRVPETHRIYPSNLGKETFLFPTYDSILCLIQTEESKYFIPEYYLYEFVDGDPDNMQLVAEQTYISADVNTTNKFEYQFISPGIYGLAVVWAEFTKSSYVDGNGKVIYTQEPNGITGSYSAVIEVYDYDGTGDSSGGTGIGATRYDWIESVEPAITYAGPRRVLLEVVTSPYEPIVADDYTVSSTGSKPTRSRDYLYLNDAGVYTITAGIDPLNNYSYAHNVTWEIEVPEWDIADGGRIEVFDPTDNSVQVTFGGEKLVSGTDYTCTVEAAEGTELVKVTVSCKNLFKGTLSGLYYADTGNPYYCDHTWKGTVCTHCGVTRVNPFTDVPEDSFYIDPVLWALDKGITTGATDTTFNPDGNCLRAQVVTFLWRAAGEPEPTTTVNPFSDVKETDFYYKAVLWAVENGITNGTSATTFSPMAECNRAAVVTFLYRAMGEPAVSSTENPFTDVDVTAFYGPAVLWAVENGITNGMGDGTFGIGKTCNRAQVVTFLYRTYQHVEP